MADKKVRTLSFSVMGEFVTRHAREKAYLDLNIKYAVELLMSCMQTDQLSEAQRLADAIAILDGRKELKGCYPGPDYGLYDIPEEQHDTNLGLQGLIEKFKARLDAAERTSRVQSEKLQFIAEQLPEYRLQQLDSEFAEAYAGCCEDEDGEQYRTIFGTNVRRPEPDPAPSPFFDTPGDMLKSYMDRMTGPDVGPDYGWLFPDGTFHPVKWGEHQSWARDWLKEHHGDGDEYADWLISAEMAGDFLSKRYGAVLLHSPWQGIAHVTKDDTVRLTKRQKEFLYDYYIKRGQNDLANAIWQDRENS